MVAWHLGTMGFAYKQWVGPFYPAGMASTKFLSHYSTLFDAVEIDSTFYGTPRATAVAKWTAVTPPHFKFCLKTPRAITHDLRLHDGLAPMGDFLAAIEPLGDKLGVILIQLPPDFTSAEQDSLFAFLAQLPTGFRYAVEFRHDSWVMGEVAEVTAVALTKHNIGWASTDYIHLPKQVHRTTDFIYLRFIGPHGQYATKDRELVDKTPILQDWYAQLKPHLEDITAVYGFFNNDYSGHSPTTCNRFKQIVGLNTEEIRPYQQQRLF